MIISASSGLQDTIFGKSQAPVKRFMEEANLAARQRSLLEHIFPMVTSDEWAEKFSSQTQIGNMRPNGENGIIPESSTQVGYEKTVENEVEWDNSISLTRRMIDDGKMGIVKRQSISLVDSYWNTREEYGARMISTVGTTMTFAGKVFNIASGDGQSLFSQAHPYIVGGAGATQSNLHDLQFTYDNLTKMEVRLNNQKVAGADGPKKINIKGNALLFPFSTDVDGDQMQDVLEALNGDGNPTSPNLSGNYHMGRWDVTFWDFLERPTGLVAGKSFWYMMDKAHIEKMQPYVFQDRIDLEISSNLAVNRRQNNWDSYARFICSPTDIWTGIAMGRPES
jgi:hypothetical protein